MEYFDSVPTSPDISYYQQDGTLWHERMLMMLTSYDKCHAAAKKIKEALKHDERSRDTNDDLISYILGTSSSEISESAIIIIDNENDKYRSYFSLFSSIVIITVTI